MLCCAVLCCAAVCCDVLCYVVAALMKQRLKAVTLYSFFFRLCKSALADLMFDAPLRAQWTEYQAEVLAACLIIQPCAIIHL